HPTLPPEDAEKAVQLYFLVFQMPSRTEADTLTIVGPQPVFVRVEDISERIGSQRHIILGDVHGCFEEMLELLEQMHFDPANDVLVSVGDIVDRGPMIRETVEYLFALPHFYMVLGNHEHKLLRYLQGRSVKVASGLQTTIDA